MTRGNSGILKNKREKGFFSRTRLGEGDKKDMKRKIIGGNRHPWVGLEFDEKGPWRGC